MWNPKRLTNHVGQCMSRIAPGRTDKDNLELILIGVGRTKSVPPVYGTEGMPGPTDSMQRIVKISLKDLPCSLSTAVGDPILELPLLNIELSVDIICV
jgi:hypothetical protein